MKKKGKTSVKSRNKVTKKITKKKKTKSKIINKKPTKEVSTHPKGIWGWLLLPTLDFIILVIISLIYFILSLSVLLSGAVNYALFIVILAGILGYLALTTLMLEFQIKKQFRFYAIITIGAAALNTIMVSALYQNVVLVGITIVCAYVWIEYFRVSKRVKNTFIK